MGAGGFVCHVLQGPIRNSLMLSIRGEGPENRVSYLSDEEVMVKGRWVVVGACLGRNYAIAKMATGLHSWLS